MRPRRLEGGQAPAEVRDVADSARRATARRRRDDGSAGGRFRSSQARIWMVKMAGWCAMRTSRRCPGIASAGGPCARLVCCGAAEGACGAPKGWSRQGGASAYVDDAAAGEAVMLDQDLVPHRFQLLPVPLHPGAHQFVPRALLQHPRRVLLPSSVAGPNPAGQQRERRVQRLGPQQLLLQVPRRGVVKRPAVHAEPGQWVGRAASAGVGLILRHGSAGVERRRVVGCWAVCRMTVASPRLHTVFQPGVGSRNSVSSANRT